MKTENTIERTICVVKNIPGGWDYISESYKEDFPDNASAVRISNYLKVSFEKRPESEIISAELSSVDTALNALFEKVQELQGKKQELLALSNLPSQENS